MELEVFVWFADCEGVDHGFETEVDFAAADDLGDILCSVDTPIPQRQCWFGQSNHITYVGGMKHVLSLELSRSSSTV